MNNDIVGGIYGWRSYGQSVEVGKEFSNNTYTFTNNTTTGLIAGIVDNGSGLNIEGSFHDNRFVITNNAVGTNPLGIYVFGSGGFVASNFVNNTFIINENSGNDAYGFFNNGDVDFLISNFSHNRFELLDNTTTNVYAIGLLDYTDFFGQVSNNTIIITDTEGVSTNTAGLFVNVIDGEVVNFEQSIQNNTFRINGDLTGDYAFSFNTNSGAGTINFDGNSSAEELSASNHNGAVTPTEATAGINYNG
jgi:hypothetical protein